MRSVKQLNCGILLGWILCCSVLFPQVPAGKREFQADTLAAHEFKLLRFFLDNLERVLWIPMVVG
jgi:hypothetical protein